jgi:hypothetical protein
MPPVVSVFRRSNIWKEANAAKPQNVVWPEYPRYDNPIVSIWWHTGLVCANFSLKSGENSNMEALTQMYENHFDPDLVKKIILSFQNVSGSYRIDGI